MDAPAWTRVQADRWREALPPWWLPAPGLLGVVFCGVLLGGVIRFDGSENPTQRWLYLLALATTLVFVGLLIRDVRVARRGGRACQEAITQEVAGCAQRRWPGPPPDPGYDHSRLPNLRALSSSQNQRGQALLPITTMYVQIDVAGMLLYATDDPSPMLRIAFSNRGVVEGIDRNGDPADGDPEDGDLEGPSPRERMMATVYGPPVLGTYLGVVVSGRHPDEDLGVATGRARRAPRTRLGGWLTRWADLLL